MTKSLILTIAFALCAYGLNAQKAESGNLSVEGLMNIGTAPNISLNGSNNSAGTTSGLRMRYFLQETMAIRIGIGLGTSSGSVSNSNADVTVTTVPAGTPSTATWSSDVENKSSNFVFSTGIEKHFAGTDNLSPYVGLAINIGMTKATTDTTMNTNDGAATPTTTTYTSTTETGWFGMGFNLVTGADWYFTEKAYLGVEFGWGMTMSTPKNSMSDVTSSTTTAGTTVSTTTKTDAPVINASGFATNVNAGFRIGYMLF